MEKEILIKLLEEGNSTYDIGKLLGKSQTSIRYWCKKHHIKVKEIKHNNRTVGSGQYKCSKCGEIKDANYFYFRRNGTQAHSYCIECNKKLVLERQHKFKLECVNYKGGKCEICGYNKNFAALEFHHENDKEKKFEISSAKHSKLEDVKDELDKCQLLCANCHREIENPIISNLVS